MCVFLFSTAAFSTSERKEQRQGDRKAVEMSLAIKQIFEAAIMCNLYPRTQIDIFVTILQADGGECARPSSPADIHPIVMKLTLLVIRPVPSAQGK